MSLNRLIVQGAFITVELIPWLEGFTPVFEGDEITFTGNKSPLVLATPKRYGFEITVNDGRQSIYQNLKTLLNEQFEGVGYVTVLDYISPEPQDADFSVRKMVLIDVKQVGSSVRINGQNLTKGLTCKFLETERRYY
jgi:hypothetical protein